SLWQPRQGSKALPAREGGVAPGLNGSPVSPKHSVENHRRPLQFSTYSSPCHPDRSEVPAERSGRTPPIPTPRECLRIFLLGTPTTTKFGKQSRRHSLE